MVSAYLIGSLFGFIPLLIVYVILQFKILSYIQNNFLNKIESLGLPRGKIATSRANIKVLRLIFLELFTNKLSFDENIKTLVNYMRIFYGIAFVWVIMVIIFAIF